MSVVFTSSKEMLTAYLEGEIDHHNAKGMRTQIDEVVIRQRPKLLILDFRGVSFMDSSGIGLVMGRYRQMQQIENGKIQIAGVTRQTAKVMRLAGLGRLAQIEERKEL